MRNTVVKVSVQLEPKIKMPLGFRGNVSSFSTMSRKRFYEFLRSILWDEIEDGKLREITLTYHNDYPNDGKEVKRHLHNFRKHIRK